MKKILLSQGQYALVDDEDYENLTRHKWCAQWDNNALTFYAKRSVRKPDGRWKPIRMHRVIMDAMPGMQVDHIDHNGLNNRKKNLRLVTNQQNSYGKFKRVRSGSRFKGVSWYKLLRKWRARIVVNYQYIHLGYFSDEETAARTYDDAARLFFGAYACVNFPSEDEQSALRKEDLPR